MAGSWSSRRPDSRHSLGGAVEQSRTGFETNAQIVTDLKHELQRLKDYYKDDGTVVKFEDDSPQPMPKAKAKAKGKAKAN